jgi:thiazole biosynthesis enzyme
MELSEAVITRAIVERYTAKLLDCIDLEVAIVGAGPAGLVAAHDLAAAGRRVALFERKLSLGGGMWGGGMMFNEIVVQEEGRQVLERFDVRCRPFQAGYYTADSVEAVTMLASRAIKAGVRIFNLITVEDVQVRQERVTGLVLNWTAVTQAGLHVDPLAIAARHIIDATGHDTDVVQKLVRLQEVRLATPSGRIEGQRPLWADRAERTTLENTREVYPGLWVAGMCANATFGSYRMGPIFGGMLLSGEQVARMILARLEEDAPAASASASPARPAPDAPEVRS